MKKPSTALAAIGLGLLLMVGAAGCAGTEILADPDQPGIETLTTETGSAAQMPAEGGSATGGPAIDEGSGGDASTSAGAATPVVTYPEPYTVIYDDEDLDDRWNGSAASFITLAGGSIRFDGAGGTADGNRVTIKAAGTYIVSGASTDGQIIIDLEEKGVVKLVLNGADITCPTSSPIYVKNATKTVITLAEGTENAVADGDSYVFEDADSNEPDAAIFAKDDLTINGSGSLTVTGNYNHGIVGRDDLKIVSGKITVKAVGDAIRGKDSIGLMGGTIAATAGGDGMQANNDVDTNKGYVDIQGGVIDIAAGEDGIQAESTLLLAGGDVTLSTGGGGADAGGSADAGGGADAGGTETTAKGLKATGAVFVTGGTLVVDSSDDSIHSNNTIRIDGGDLTLSSGDDGVHADNALDINGGELTVVDSNEGIESAIITIKDGIVRVKSSDDGINVAGGAGDSSVSGRRGPGAFAVNENNKLYIDGGYVAIDARGDGVDCNGRIFMTGGTLIVNGPVSDGNGALDYLGEFTISGGYVVAVGSSGMAQAPSRSSALCSIMIGFDSAQAAGTLVHIADQDGNDMVTIAPTKEFKSVLLCSAEIREGATYTVYVGGICTGTVTDGVYSGGVYTPGTEYAVLTVSGVVTTYGSFGGMGAMMGDFAPGGAHGGRGGGGFPGGAAPEDGE